jgi:hypothetical protein
VERKKRRGEWRSRWRGEGIKKENEEEKKK